MKELSFKIHTSLKLSKLRTIENFEYDDICFGFICFGFDNITEMFSDFLDHSHYKL